MSSENGLVGELVDVLRHVFRNRSNYTNDEFGMMNTVSVRCKGETKSPMLLQLHSGEAKLKS